MVWRTYVALSVVALGVLVGPVALSPQARAHVVDSWAAGTLLIHSVAPETLAAGDHVYVKRLLGLYTHHGLYVGQGRVVHFGAGPHGLELRSDTLEAFLGGQVRAVRRALGPPLLIHSPSQTWRVRRAEYGVPRQVARLKLVGTVYCEA